MPHLEPIEEFAVVVLTADVDGADADGNDRTFADGTIGTVVHVHSGVAAMILEVFGAEGETVGIVTVRRADVRRATPDDLARRTASAA